MAPTDLAGGPELAARIDEMLAADQAVAVLGARVDLPDDDPVPGETVAERLSCPLVRVLRLLGAVCAMDDDFTTCGPIEGESARFQAAVAPAVEAGLCQWERWGPVSLLVFEPVEVDVGTLRLRP